MCNLYRMTSNVEAIRRLFAVSGDAPNLPRFSEALPKRSAPVIWAGDGDVRRINVSRGITVPAAAQLPESQELSFWPPQP